MMFDLCIELTPEEEWAAAMCRLGTSRLGQGYRAEMSFSAPFGLWGK